PASVDVLTHNARPHFAKIWLICVRPHGRATQKPAARNRQEDATHFRESPTCTSRNVVSGARASKPADGQPSGWPRPGGLGQRDLICARDVPAASAAGRTGGQ